MGLGHEELKHADRRHPDPPQDLGGEPVGGDFVFPGFRPSHAGAVSRMSMVDVGQFVGQNPDHGRFEGLLRDIVHARVLLPGILGNPQGGQGRGKTSPRELFWIPVLDH